MSLLPERTPKRRFARWRTPLILLVLVALGAALALELRTGTAPLVAFDADQPGVGQRPATVHVSTQAPDRGLASLRIEAVQGETVTVLHDQTYATPPAWAFWRAIVPMRQETVIVGRETVPGLVEGPLTLRAIATLPGTLLRRGPSTIAEQALPVRLRPPTSSLVSRLNYAEQGGSGLVRYRVDSEALEGGGRHGVMAGSWFFPGHPLPAAADAPDGNERFALFGIPYDLTDDDDVRLVVEDAVGNRTTMPFLANLSLEPVRTDDIRLSDAFFAEVVPEILAQTPDFQPEGSLLEQYLAINGDLRQRNAETLRALAEDSRAAFLWQGAFRQLPNSQVTSTFADRRTYVYDGRPVDRQDHLGFDLASVRQAPVPASNAGRVVLARYFGIYGNTVVVDHGYGLLTLYSHLSSIAVSVGDAVTADTILGRTGETGLAAGDHLHFTMLIGGLAVNPTEWWDAQWVHNRISTPLGTP